MEGAMKSHLLRPSVLLLVAALFVSALPVFAPLSASTESMSAAAQTRRTRRTTRSRRVYTDTSLVRVGTELRASLNDELSSEDSRVGDRFTATVLAPEQYEGARVLGHIRSINKSGRVKGTTTMTLAFDSLEMPGGRRGNMRGELIRVYDSESSSKVDEEGHVESGSRGKQTLKRGGIGAAAGAVLGGIMGGGKGAAIGLIIGGAAGAGSIAIEGSKELELKPGTEMLIRVTSR
jgi:hypothetical protein